MVKANDGNEAMERETWNDIKRVRDEAEWILRAPYDVSLKVSCVFATLSTFILASPICFGWKNAQFMVVNPYQFCQYSVLMIVIILRSFEICWAKSARTR